MNQQANYCIEPEEWDFRTITEHQLGYAIIYEYGRSCDWLKQSFRNWHRRKLKLRSGAELSDWRNLSVGQALKRIEETYQRAVEWNPPAEVVQFIAESRPKGEDEQPRVEIVRHLDNLFPRPFLKIPDLATSVNLLRETFPLKSNKPAFYTLDRARAFALRYPGTAVRWDDPGDAKRLSRLGLRRFEIILDLRYSKNRLKDEINKWVDELDDSGVQKFRVKTGKGASEPWNELKELAAYRLKAAGFNYRTAKEFIEMYIKENRVEHNHSVLPSYSKSRWTEAIQSAEARILKLFPLPGK
jgi:hypothetical protein